MGTQLVEQNELKETLELKERIENNTVVELWENSEDYERLANATRKTMRYINDEQIKSFADARVPSAARGQPRSPCRAGGR